MSASNARLQHSAAPYGHASRVAELMNRQRLRISANSSNFDIDHPATSEVERVFGPPGIGDAFVETNWRGQLCLQLRVIHEIVVIQRLLDHEQTEFIESP